MKRARTIIFSLLSAALLLVAGCDSAALPAGDAARAEARATAPAERWTILHLVHDEQSASLQAQLWVAAMDDLDRDRLERALGVTAPGPLEGCEYVPGALLRIPGERVRFLEAGDLRLRSDNDDVILRARSVGSVSDAVSGVSYHANIEGQSTSLRLQALGSDTFAAFAQRIDVPEPAQITAINGEAIGSAASWQAEAGDITLELDATPEATLWVRDADEPGRGALACAVTERTMVLDAALLRSVQSATDSTLDLTLVSRREAELSRLSEARGVIVGESRGRLRLER